MSAGEIVFYQSEEDELRLEVKLEDESVWLSQQQMADLFQTSRTNVVEHIKHIYDEQELDENLTCRNFRQVRKEGSREVARDISYYNLLDNAGTVSSREALEKAEKEYRKYQTETISPVEAEYLRAVETAARTAKRNLKKRDNHS